MEMRNKVLIIPLIAYAASIAVGSFSSVSAQPLRQARPDIKVFGSQAADDSKLMAKPGAGASKGGPGQVRNYRQRKSAPPQTNLSSAKPKDTRKLTADALRFYNEGLAEETKGNLDGATAKFKQSLTIREYYWREQDRTIPVILEKLANVYFRQNKLAESIAALDKSLTYYTKMYGPGTTDRIPSLMLMGKVQQQKNDSAASFEYYKQAYTLI